MKFYENSGTQKEQSLGYPDLSSKIKQKQNKQKTDPLRASIFLDKKAEQEEQGCLKKLCACTQLEYYKDYYKVTNSEVKRRILCNLKFWQGKFFSPAEQDYDFYGPFWIFTTVIFCLGAVHNILQYQANPNFAYDYIILGQAFFTMYALGFGLPAAIAFIMKGLGVNVTVMQIICLYGYGASNYVFAIILCSIDVCLLHWIFLAYGAASKFFFLFKNIHQGFDIPAAKKIIVTVAIGIQVALQVLLFKFRFVICPDSPAAVLTTTAAHLMGLENQALHYRTFNHQNM